MKYDIKADKQTLSVDNGCRQLTFKVETAEDGRFLAALAACILDGGVVTAEPKDRLQSIKRFGGV